MIDSKMPLAHIINCLLCQNCVKWQHKNKCFAILSHNFGCFQDLLALLKNVESEIASTEQNLRDEIEKRKKYAVSNYVVLSF